MDAGAGIWILVFLGVTDVLLDYGAYARGPPGLDSNKSGNEVRPTESEQSSPDRV